jgi:hypothetical protein
MSAHPVGQAVVVVEVVAVFAPAVTVVATGAVFFAADLSVDGATAVCSAQAGTTRIKVNKHSSILFIVISL